MYVTLDSNIHFLVDERFSAMQCVQTCTMHLQKPGKIDWLRIAAVMVYIQSSLIFVRRVFSRDFGIIRYYLLLQEGIRVTAPYERFCVSVYFTKNKQAICASK